MTLHRAADYLDHMIEAAQQACAYVEGLDKADFLDDKRTQQGSFSTSSPWAKR